ncbi:hypothetical protein [Catellatospora methionotrophica]|uniref:hypothetical protein n=1 Tax=Catellatospora methionotrophica TaxID=121620 RepID=UPI0033F4EE46
MIRVQRLLRYAHVVRPWWVTATLTHVSPSGLMLSAAEVTTFAQRRMTGWRPSPLLDESLQIPYA